MVNGDVPAMTKPLQFEIQLDDYIAAAHAASLLAKQKGQQRRKGWGAWLTLTGVTFVAIGLVIYNGKAHNDRFDPTEFADQLGSAGQWIVFAILVCSFRGAVKLGRSSGRLMLSAGTAVGALIALFAMHFQSNVRPRLEWVGWVVILAFAIQYWQSLFWRQSYRAHWAGVTHLHGTKWLSWDVDGFQIADPHRRLLYQWQALTSWQETSDLFLLFVSNLTFHIIPKRAFGNDEELLKQFRKVIADVTETKGHAFPVVPSATIAGR